MVLFCYSFKGERILKGMVFNMAKVYEGTIITVDQEDRVCKFLVEDQGRIVYVGNTLPLEFRKEERVQLGKRCLLPSFADTHLHFASLAMFHTGIQVMDVKNNAEMLERLKKFEKQTKQETIIGFGASPHSVEERKLVTREELDQVSLKRPIMIVKYDGHAAIVNSELLRRLPEEIKQTRGYDPISGEMNQEAFFRTTDYVSSKISIFSLVKSMQRTVDYMASKGIGMMHSVSGVGFPNDLDVDMEQLVGLGIKGGFQTRIFFQTMEVNKVKKRKLPRIGGCFITALDGCYGSMDAALYEPYVGTDQNGVLYYSDETVIEFCKKANREGLQIELHAIGDRAFDQAVRAIKAALDDFPRANHRHGIIHACLPTKEGLKVCGDYQIQIPLQTSFIDWPQEPDWYLREIMGERESKLNPLRSFLDYKILISAGSDSPCTDPDPMLWIHNAVNHPIQNQALTVSEAIRMCTWNGYYTSFDERERGSLEVGKIADMVVLEKNPLEVQKENLKSIQVLELYLNGNKYQNQKGSPLLLLLRGLMQKGRKII